MKNIVQDLLSPAPLALDQIDAFMSFLCDETKADEQKAFAIGAVMMRGVPADFLTQAARYLLKRAGRLDIANDRAIDVCGTGGDTGAHKTKTFNISTATSFVLAAEGVPVIKHGNRAVSSLSGSSDVLDALKVPASTDPAGAKACFAKHNMCFVSAPHFHPVLRNVMNVRKAIGVPTFFNLLGPLLNPAMVKRQLIGVYEASVAEKMAEAAKGLGKTDVMIVHSDDGLDEISLCAPTHLYHLKDGSIKHTRITPEDFGLSYVEPEQIRGGTAEVNARIIETILSGEPSGKTDVVCLNAAAAFVVAGVEVDIQSGLNRARAVVESGKALAKLNEMRG